MRCGAACGVDQYERVEALLEAEADVIVIDTSHGHSENVLRTLRTIKQRYPGVEVIAGNVATAEGAAALAMAGADAVKAGIGPGSICTTRVVTGVGVPQITAILEAVRGIASCGRDIPVIADGGIRQSGDIAKALAAGAEAVMLGSLMAGLDQSPGELVISHGRRYKSYRGMGSEGAMFAGSADRYGQHDDAQSAEEATRDEGGRGGKLKFVPEGVEGLVAYRGPLAEYVFQLVGGLRASMGYCGCKIIAEFREHTRFVRISRDRHREPPARHPHHQGVAELHGRHTPPVTPPLAPPPFPFPLPVPPTRPFTRRPAAGRLRTTCFIQPAEFMISVERPGEPICILLHRRPTAGLAADITNTSDDPSNTDNHIREAPGVRVRPARHTEHQSHKQSVNHPFNHSIGDRTVMQSNNPVLTRGAFAREMMATDRIGNFELSPTRRETMTVQGAAMAALILVGITGATASLAWGLLVNRPTMYWPIMIPGVLIYFLGGWIINLKPRIAPYLAPVLSIALGGFLGAASLAYSAWVKQGTNNIAAAIGDHTVLLAVVLTFGIFFALLIGYAGKILRPNQTFVSIVTGLTGALFFGMIAVMLLNMFVMPGLFGTIWSSPLGLVIAGGIVVLASMMLLVDIKQVDELAQAGVPKHMEWVAAFGLLTTLVWLYISVLRLLAVLANRD